MHLFVEIGGHNTKAVFGVAPNLATNVIFGTAFIDKEINSIESKIQQIKSRSGLEVAIVASFENENAVQFNDGITKGTVCTAKLNTAVCRVAEAWKVLPASEAPRLVQTGVAGT